LQTQIDEFHQKAIPFWGLGPDGDEDDWDDIQPISTDMPFVHSDTDEDDEDDIFGQSSQLDSPSVPERRPILLPSTLGKARCIQLGYTSFAEQELRLRIGEANDALQGLRLCLSRKALIFQEGLRTSKSKTKKLRSWNHIKLADGSAQHQASLYCKARAAMIRLDAGPQLLERYQVLTREHMSITTAKIDPSQRGQRNTSLAWFWTMNVKSDTEAVEGMSECERRQLSLTSGSHCHSL
jgi:hypothetical protein